MNKIKAFLIATRPKTLAASIVPVLIGSSIAYSVGKFNFGISILIIICSMLIQIITNYINEIYDFKHGADNPDRIGPKRMVASGQLSPKEMATGVIVLMIVCFLLGIILVQYSDYKILLVGIFSFLFAYLYTGGPYPIAYKGLGDIFVFLFFGIIAVCGTYYIFTKEVTLLVLIASFAPGFLSTNILGINNFRDIETDKKVNKITLAVRIGRKASRLLYISLILLTYISLVIIFFITHSFYVLMPFVTIPLAIKLIRDVYIKTGSELNSTLAGTAGLLLIYGLISSISFILM